MGAIGRRLLDGIELDGDCQLPAEIPALTEAQEAAAAEAAAAVNAEVLDEFFQLQVPPALVPQFAVHRTQASFCSLSGPVLGADVLLM